MKKQRGLGKGLDALIPPTEEESGQVFLCPVEAITPHPHQPRKRFDENSLQELVQTIREKGILSPVIVRSYGEGYQLISGERRWRAAKMAGLKHIPAILREVSDREALEISLVENIQREDLTPLEEARAYKALLDLYGTTQEDLARRLGKDRSTISNSLRLLKLPLRAQEALENGDITAGHARCILAVPQEKQIPFLQAILAKGLSVRAAEALAREILGNKKPSSQKPLELPSDLIQLRDTLRARLSTQVRIVHGKKKGAIIIEYYGPSDLDRIRKLLGLLP